MVWQGVLTERFELTVFLGGMLVAGVPGAIQAMALLTGRIGGESSSPAVPPSSPEPSTPSSTG